MNELFEKNIEKINKYRSVLSDIVNTYNVESEIEFGSELIDNRDVFFATKNGLVYQLDSMYENEIMLNTWADAIDIPFSGRYFIFGIGNGMYVKKLLKETDDNSRILIYEPSAYSLIGSMNHFDLSSILEDKRVIIILPELEKIGLSLFKLIGGIVDYSDIPNIRRFTYPNYEILFENESNYFSNRVDEIIASMRSNRRVYERFGHTFAINGINNAKYIVNSRDIYDLRDKFPKNFPAIMVSCGPSLSKNIELLKEIKGRAFVVAADSAVKVLLAHGIIPDLFGSIDSDKSPAHFDDPETKSIPMLGDFSSCPGAVDGHHEPIFFTKTENPFLSDFFDARNIKMPKLATGGSIANTLMSMLLELEFNKIIMIGQDLAYTGEKSHADGATRASWNLDLDTNSMMVEGIDGNPIKSSTEFIHYRNWFERTIEQYPEVEVINATEGGARIHGTKEMTFRDAIDQYCMETVNCSEILTNAKYILTDEQKQEFIEYTSSVEEGFATLSSYLKKGIRIYEEMLEMIYERKYQSAQFVKKFEKSKEINQLINNEKCLYYAECMVQNEMTALLDERNTEVDEKLALIVDIESARNRLDILLEGVNRISKYIK